MKNLRVVAVTAAFAVTSALVSMPAFAADAAQSAAVPDINVSIATATCENPENTITVTGLDTKDQQYRFVFYLDGKLDRQVNKNARPLFYQGPVTDSKLAAAYGGKIERMKELGLYSKTLQMKVYYYDKHGKFAGPHETLEFPTTELSPLKKDPLRKAFKLAESEVVTLVDPASLDCKSTDNGNSNVADGAQSAAVSVSHVEKAAGEKIVFTGQGFNPEEQVSFEVHSEVIKLAPVKADAKGVATVEWTIPAGFTLGKHTVKATGMTSKKSAMNTFTVLKAAEKQENVKPTDPKQPADPKKVNPKGEVKKVNPKADTKNTNPKADAKKAKLANTGSSSALIAAGASAIAVAGIGASIVVRRRKN